MWIEKARGLRSNPGHSSIKESGDGKSALLRTLKKNGDAGGKSRRCDVLKGKKVF